MNTHEILDIKYTTYITLQVQNAASKSKVHTEAKGASKKKSAGIFRKKSSDFKHSKPKVGSFTIDVFCLSPEYFLPELYDIV